MRKQASVTLVSIVAWGQGKPLTLATTSQLQQSSRGSHCSQAFTTRFETRSRSLCRPCWPPTPDTLCAMITEWTITPDYCFWLFTTVFVKLDTRLSENPLHKKTPFCARMCVYVWQECRGWMLMLRIFLNLFPPFFFFCHEQVFYVCGCFEGVHVCVSGVCNARGGQGRLLDSLGL